MTQLTNFFDLVTVTRSSGATRVNALGLIENVPANRPRADYDPVTGALRGLLIEEARTNLFLNSFISGANLSTQSVSVSAQPHTISFYGTGSITLSGAHSAVINGSGNYPNRATFTFTPAAGVVTCTVTGDVQFANFEQGSFATSFIPTASAAATRAAEQPSIDGDNFAKIFNPNQGTIYLEVSKFGAAGYSTALILRGNGLQDRLPDLGMGQGIAGTSGGVFRCDVLDGTITQAVLGSNEPFVQNQVEKCAFLYAQNDFAFAHNGQISSADDSGTLPSPDILDIGHRRGGSQLNGHIKNLLISPRRQNNDVALTPENWIET